MKSDFDHDSWSFTSKDIFHGLGFSPSDAETLQSHGEVVAEAAVIAFNARTVTEEKKAQISSTAPLFVPGKRYHIGLSKSAKEMVTDAVRTVSIALLLHNLRMFDFAITLSVRGIMSMVNQVTRLSNEQRRAVLKILDLKRASKSRTYWPTTRKLAGALKLSQKRISAILTPINGKVVALDPESGAWRVLW